MMRSLFSGVSGLRNHQTRMDVIGNNISNVNTVGYKSSRVIFQDIFSQNISAGMANSGVQGGTNPIQVGLGISLSTIDVIHTRSAFQRTDRPTDMMINGDGFFVVRSPDGDFFTRAGNFTIDDEGFLVTSQGFFVMGYNVPLEMGVIDHGRDEIPPIPADLAQATAWNTDGIPVGTTIPAGFFRTGDIIPVGLFTTATGPWPSAAEGPITVRAGDPPVPSTPMATNALNLPPIPNPAHAAWVIVRDAHDAWVAAEPPSADPGHAAWVAAEPPAPGTEPDVTIPDPSAGPGGTFMLSRNIGVGAVRSIQRAVPPQFGLVPIADPDLSTLSPIRVMFPDTAQIPNPLGLEILSQIEWMANPTPEDGRGEWVIDWAAMGTTMEAFFGQFPVGDISLPNFAVADNGDISVLSGGRNVVIARVAVAMFSNPAGLEVAGGNIFRQTAASGEAIVGQAGLDGAGAINGGGLEMSNVDMADQFTDMIVTQRGFQANSRIISTTDEMLQEIVNLRR